MLGHLQQINGAVNGMGFLVDRNRPFINFLVKNWWLAGIAGLAITGRIMERKKKNELSTFNLMADVGFVLTPLVGLAMLNQLACEAHNRDQAAAAQIPVDPNVIPTPPMPA